MGLERGMEIQMETTISFEIEGFGQMMKIEGPRFRMQLLEVWNVGLGRQTHILRVTI